DHRERWMGLGPLWLVGLIEARESALSAHRQLRLGLDPIDTRKAERAVRASEAQKAAAKAVTFEEGARECYDQHAGKWKNAKHSKQWLTSMEIYAFPIIGKVAVGDVDEGLVLKVLEQKHKRHPSQRLWDAITESANRLRGRIEDTLEFARVR